jgi:hypothetical protein
MGLFGKAKAKSVEEEIAKTVLEQEDRLSTLFAILDNLPNDLVEWFTGILKARSATKGYVEVDLSVGVNLGLGVLPGDVIIRKNRDPKINDIVEIGMRDAEGYSVASVKVLKINIKEGTLFVQNLLDEDAKGSIAINNIICVIDKIIKYGDSEWKKTVQLLDIDADSDTLESWVKKSIHYVKNEKFHDKENTLKQLEERLKLLKKR